MLLSRLIFDFVNFTEAKLAKLQCDSRSIDGLEVFYHSNTKHFSTDKPVLVLLHGFSADKYVWNRFAKRFSSQYHLVIPDLKGHGQTAYRASDDYSVPSQCKMLLALLEQLNIKRFSIVGNSMGGMMAAKLFDEMPKRIEKAVLIDPAGAKSLFAQNMIDSQQNPFDHEVEQDFFNFYDLIMTKPPFVPRFILRALAWEYISKRAQYTHMFNQFFNLRDFYPRDYRFDYPESMLIWGLNDKLLPVDDFTHWKMILNSNTLIYEDLGHMPMVEDVRRVSKDILSFLNKH
ncbi:alpha/beta hydrolase [Alteromonas sp. MMG017]|uniref:alpha/beta fold hydrolase n=1 Tax=Alteromonas sp. MMG017 TaxID=2822692 RepID=UPI001FFD58EE|nr:alpha/beta hydrolase [Alteromonas sp. MMG017]